jgi:hypothetical protein
MQFLGLQIFSQIIFPRRQQGFVNAVVLLPIQKHNQIPYLYPLIYIIKEYYPDALPVSFVFNVGGKE